MLLLSIDDLWGGATKKQVLDNIDEQGYLAFNDHDLSIKTNMTNKNELVWRNDMAYIRLKLVTDGYLSYNRDNNWEITSKGDIYLQKLCRLSIGQTNFQKLTQKAINRANSLVQKLNIEQELKNVEAVVALDLEALQIEEEPFVEGEQRERYTNYYERDPKLRAKAISLHGTKCMACNFDFEKKYGERGKGFIEIHHLKPVSELGGNTKVDPETDLTVVCSNCHRMIHRKKNDVLSLEELRKFIQSEEVIRT